MRFTPRLKIPLWEKSTKKRFIFNKTLSENSINEGLIGHINSIESKKNLLILQEFILEGYQWEKLDKWVFK